VKLDVSQQGTIYTEFESKNVAEFFEFLGKLVDSQVRLEWNRETGRIIPDGEGGRKNETYLSGVFGKIIHVAVLEHDVEVVFEGGREYSISRDNLKTMKLTIFAPKYRNAYA
jgi:hypothetical protein